MYEQCHDGRTGMPLNHLAEVWLVGPNGKRIVTLCRSHADGAIKEYREKLGEEWATSPIDPRLSAAAQRLR